MPVQPGWVDALLREVTFSIVDFFFKGSLHRGRKLDDIVLYPDDAGWVGHIHGNALYKANDPDFTSMISQTREANRGSMSFTSSFDTVMWIQHVTSFAARWKTYQNYAQKFQYTDLIQNLNEDVSSHWRARPRGAVARYVPGARLVSLCRRGAQEEDLRKGRGRGDSGSVGEELGDPFVLARRGTSGRKSRRASAAPLRPKAFLPDKVAIVIPLISSQIEKLRVLLSLSSEEGFRPCVPERVGGAGSGGGGMKGMPIDLVFQISSKWLDESGTAGNEAYHALSALVDEYPRFTSCFDRLHTLAANLMPSEDIHTAYMFTGPTSSSAG